MTRLCALFRRRPKPPECEHAWRRTGGTGWLLCVKCGEIA